jgi:hypothetical protein
MIGLIIKRKTQNITLSKKFPNKKNKHLLYYKRKKTDNTKTKRRTDNTMTKRRTDNTMTKRRTDNTMTKTKKHNKIKQWSTKLYTEN